MTTNSRAPHPSIVQDIDLFKSCYETNPKARSGPLRNRTGDFCGEFRARWQRVLTLQFVRFNFLPDMYHTSHESSQYQLRSTSLIGILCCGGNGITVQSA